MICRERGYRWKLLRNRGRYLRNRGSERGQGGRRMRVDDERYDERLGKMVAMTEASADRRKKTQGDSEKTKGKGGRPPSVVSVQAEGEDYA